MANGMGLDRAPIKIQKLFFLKPPILGKRKMKKNKKSEVVWGWPERWGWSFGIVLGKDILDTTKAIAVPSFAILLF